MLSGAAKGPTAGTPPDAAAPAPVRSIRTLENVDAEIYEGSTLAMGEVPGGVLVYTAPASAVFAAATSPDFERAFIEPSIKGCDQNAAASWASPRRAFMELKSAVPRELKTLAIVSLIPEQKLLKMK
jgi:hypothetical protein